jgi:hypothetical protein
MAKSEKRIILFVLKSYIYYENIALHNLYYVNHLWYLHIKLAFKWVLIN